MSTTETNLSDIAVQVSVHPDYEEAKYEIEKIRDCVDGAPKIKRETYTYLPHPSQVDSESEEQKSRYSEFISGAEFDDQPKDTLQTLLGKMRLHESTVTIPARIGYLVDNADGDGQSLTSTMESAVSNVIQTKWHVLVADYSGLSGLNLQDISKSDRESLNVRSKIKQYRRENVVNWHFARIDGVMQLRWIMLLEVGTEFNETTYTHTAVQSYLILALDEKGEYYQKKIVYSQSGKTESEPSYVTIDQKPIKFLPLEIISDQELEPGRLPIAVGSIHKICEAALHKYRVSAVYKEVQRNLAPTTITKGWQSGDLALFTEINGGRSYISTGPGSVNNLPSDVEYNIVSAAMNMDDFQWYFTYADKKILAMGGVAKQEVGNMTATEADINSNEQNSKLVTIADNTEKSFERVLLYCLMFEGGITQEQINAAGDDVSIALPRDFASPKLTVDEVRVILEMIQMGVRTREQAIKALAQGGWDYQDAITTMLELEEQGPATNL